MNPEQRVAVLEDLLHKVRMRARAAGARASAVPSTHAFRGVSVPTAAALEPSIPAAMISAVPQTIPEERRTSVPAPVLLRAAFAPSGEVALIRGEVSAAAPPRSFSECA